MIKKRFIILTILLLFSLSAIFAQAVEQNTNNEKTSTEQTSNNESKSSNSSIKYIAAALAVGIACIGGGMAVGKIGSAAMGAMSENENLSGKALPFVGLAEGICLWGFLVGLLIIVM